MAEKAHTGKKKSRTRTTRFKDGSRLVTYPDGSMMILESGVAHGRVMGETKQLVKYPTAPDEVCGIVPNPQ